jgi:hypothetical protein
VALTTLLSSANVSVICKNKNGDNKGSRQFSCSARKRRVREIENLLYQIHLECNKKVRQNVTLKRVM